MYLTFVIGIQYQVEKGLSGEQAGLGLRSFDFTTSSSIASECPWSEELKCDTERQGSMDTIYRRADGSCNNLKEPYYGRSTTPFQRLANPKYAAVNSNTFVLEKSTKVTNPWIFASYNAGVNSSPKKVCGGGTFRCSGFLL